MSTEKIIFLIVMGVTACAYVAFMVRQYNDGKRMMREVEVNFARYMAEYDRWMRGE